MIVYGDHAETVAPRDRLAALDARRLHAETLVPGLERHQHIVTLLIEFGRLAQGLADADCWGAAEGGRREAEHACHRLLLQLARAVIASWDSGFATSPSLPRLTLDTPLPETVRLNLPEGYALYALYPECYAEAARRLTLLGTPVVIGIRSIGTSLAAIAAAALGCDRFWTVRPGGHPFARALRLSDDVQAELIAPDRSYVIVDEGPGLSGSSFNCVADWLEARGVPRNRIAFLPSHGGGLGPQASDAHRERWRGAQRPVFAAQQLIVASRLPDWAASLLEPLQAPMEDLSGGAWRAHVWPDETFWPAVDPGQERLKYRVRAGGERWLLKFAGLGEMGERKLAHARLLHAAGFVAEPAGLLHGFLVERWREGTPVDRADDALLAFAGRYFAARAMLLPAEAAGASLPALLEMARHNAALALGEATAAQLDSWAEQLPALEERVVPAMIDGRCERHEWLRIEGGGFLKADALDHHAGHDLIGCQDIAWDVAGFAIESGLSQAQQARLIAEVETMSGRAVDRQLFALLSLCYLGFRLGQRDMTAASLGNWEAEQQRNLAARDSYAGLLRERLNAGWTAG